MSSKRACVEVFLAIRQSESMVVYVTDFWSRRFMSGKKVSNVFEAILKYGHDEDFVPAEGDEFSATDAPAGSDAKILTLRERVELGLPLWHNEDRVDYTGLTGAIRPRE